MSGGLNPLPGDPGRVLSMARGLAAMADELRATHRVLLSLRTDAVWVSPAGRSFGARAAECPPVLDRVAGRYDGAAEALAVFSVALAEAQQASTTAIERHTGALARRDRYLEAEDRALTSHSAADQAMAPAYRAEMVAAAGDVAASEHAYAVAMQRFQAADRRCAAALGALSGDELVDSLTYRSLTTGSSLAGGVAGSAGTLALVPVLTPVFAPVAASAGLGQLGLDVSVRVAYGDGDWGEIGGAAAATVLPQAALVLRQGARAGGLATAATQGPSEGLSLGTRLGRGAREYVRTDAPWRAPGARAPRPAPAAPPSSPSSPSSSGLPPRLLLRERALQRARAVADARVLDDWRVATRNGPTAQRLLGASWGVRATSHALSLEGRAAAAEAAGHDHGDAGGHPPLR